MPITTRKGRNDCKELGIGIGIAIAVGFCSLSYFSVSESPGANCQVRESKICTNRRAVTK